MKDADNGMQLRPRQVTTISKIHAQACHRRISPSALSRFVFNKALKVKVRKQPRRKYAICLESFSVSRLFRA